MPASTDSANRNCQAGSTVSARRGPGAAVGDDDGFTAVGDSHCSSLSRRRKKLAGRGGLAAQRDLLVVVSIGQLGLHLLEFRPAARAEQCQGGLHRQRAGR